MQKSTCFLQIPTAYQRQWLTFAYWILSCPHALRQARAGVIPHQVESYSAGVYCSAALKSATCRHNAILWVLQVSTVSYGDWMTKHGLDSNIIGAPILQKLVELSQHL